jgi:hypothetical protein
LRDPTAAGELSTLMFGQEVARSPENVALNAMALDQMRDKKLDTLDMLQSLPAQPTGASGAQRALVKAANDKQDLSALADAAHDKGEAAALVQDEIAAEAKGKDKKAREKAEAKAEKARAKGDVLGEVLNRTIKLITDWVKPRLKSDPPITKSKKGLINWLEKKIRERVTQVIRDGN